jgi:hypothetical protein
MTATNHALTGAVIGLAVGQPLIALPVAFLSHFVCDALPHYASADPPEKVLKTGRFRDYLIVEATLCALIVLILAITRPDNWLLASFCAFLAASPDFFWINRYMKTRAGLTWRPNLFSRLALGIQWFAKPIGAAFEAAWAAAAIIIIAMFIRA